MRSLRIVDDSEGVAAPSIAFDVAPTVVGVAWNSPELPMLLGALLSEGARVEGPLRPTELQGRHLGPRSVIVADLRAGIPDEADLSAVLTQEVPSIALVRREIASVEEAILAGASSVLASPVSPGILAAQVRNLARLTEGRPAPETIDVGPLQVNPVNYAITWKGLPVHLSPAQFKILQLLCARPGQVQTPEDLARVSLGYTLSPQEAGSVVKIHIHRIRTALEAVDPSASSILQNVRGFGYMIAEGAFRQAA